MEKFLVIVESPTKANTINKYLGKNYIVKASLGHIKNLPQNKLGVDINNNFKPEYTIIKGKSRFINEIKREAKNSDLIFIATDPDREGEAIAWHIAQEIDSKNDRMENVQSMLQNLSLRQSEVSGVDINDEAAQLMIYEQMYQAMARYMSGVQEMMNTLMNAV